LLAAEYEGDDLIILGPGINRTEQKFGTRPQLDNRGLIPILPILIQASALVFHPRGQ